MRQGNVYRSCKLRSRATVDLIARQRDVEDSTVRHWLRRARDEGHIEPREGS